MAVPNRLSGSLPLSVAVHLVAFVLLLVIPLTAEMALPVPASAMDDYIKAVPAPPPPPAPIVRSAVRRSSEPAPAPIEAPRAIVPEVERPPAAPLEIDGGVPFAGPPGMIGAPTGGLREIPPPPPPPPAPAGPVRAGVLVQTPQKIVDVRPVYPEIARAARVGGTVVLEAVLDRTGHVSQVRVVKSVPLLDQAAIDAVRGWRYRPSTLHGVPVEVLMTVTVSFMLQE